MPQRALNLLWKFVWTRVIRIRQEGRTISMKIRNLHRGLGALVGVAAILGLLQGSSYAQSSNDKGRKIELTFDLSKCQQVSPNLYKCPAIDKPICTTEFSQPGVECVHLGKKGSVFVMGPGGMGP